MGVNLKGLIGKCNDETRMALEAAAGLCLSRTHYDVEIEHYLMKLLDQTDGDCAAILKNFGIDRSHLATELTRSLDRLKSGNARNPTLILALVSDEELSRLMRDVSREFGKINPAGLKKDFFTIVEASQERDYAEGAAGEADAGSGAGPRPAGGKTPNLDQFTVDLTARAKAGK